MGSLFCTSGSAGTLAGDGGVEEAGCGESGRFGGDVAGWESGEEEGPRGEGGADGAGVDGGCPAKIISRRCHNMNWFTASPSSSIPSGAGISSSNEVCSAWTLANCTLAYLSRSGVLWNWRPGIANPVPTSFVFLALPIGTTRLHGVGPVIRSTT